MLPAFALALVIGAFVSAGSAHAQSAAAEGQKLAFDRSKGNCLTCHAIKGGTLPGSIGPELIDIKGKYPNREDLVARLRRSAEAALRSGKMTLDESRNLLRVYEEGLAGYTYLERE